MPRRVVVVAVYLALSLILSGCRATALRPEALEDKVLPYLHEAQQAIRDDDWQTASDKLQEAQRTWKQVKPMLSLVSTANEMDRLEESLIRARAAVEARAFANALEEVAQSVQNLDQVVNW
ncbi:MAG: DUF4363 family protein [Bacillota bacterium]